MYITRKEKMENFEVDHLHSVRDSRIKRPRGSARFLAVRWTFKLQLVLSYDPCIKISNSFGSSLAYRPFYSESYKIKMFLNDI